MITVIFTVSTNRGLENLKRSLINLEPSWKLGLDILCLVEDTHLYNEAKEYLSQNVDIGRSLTVHQSASFKKAGEYLAPQSKFVYLAGESTIIPWNAVTQLYQDFIEHPEAGFLTGLFIDYDTAYWVKDIYGLPGLEYATSERLQEDITEIDTSFVYGMLTKTSLFQELFCLSDLDGYGEHSFGVRLRRQGYKNYLDKRVRYGERNG